VHKPMDPNAFFGNSYGQFLAFHVDPDLEPAKDFGRCCSGPESATSGRSTEVRASGA
jgi:hypothetical protein